MYNRGLSNLLKCENLTRPETGPRMNRGVSKGAEIEQGIWDKV